MSLRGATAAATPEERILAVVRAIQPVWQLPGEDPVFDFMRGTSITGLPEGHSGIIPTTGRIDPNEVRKVVRANFDKFTACCHIIGIVIFSGQHFFKHFFSMGAVVFRD